MLSPMPKSFGTLFLIFCIVNSSNNPNQQPQRGYSGPPPNRNYPPPSYPPEGQPEHDQEFPCENRPDERYRQPAPGPGYKGPPPPGYRGQIPPPGYRGQPPPPGYRGQPPPPGYRGQPPPPGYRGQPPPPGYRGPPNQMSQQGGYPPSYINRPTGQGGYPSPNPQQGNESDSGSSFFSKVKNKFKSEGPPQQAGIQYGQPRNNYPPQQYNRPSNTWQGQMAQPGQPRQGFQSPGPGAMTPAGPIRGPVGPQQSYRPVQNGQPSYVNEGEGQPGWTGGFKNLFGKVFTGDSVHDSMPQTGPSSFRPNGSKLKKKMQIAAISGQDSYPGSPYMGYPGSPMQGGIGATSGGTAVESQASNKPEFISIDESIVFILKPNNFEQKKRKFKMDGQGKLQVFTVFEGGLGSFTSKEGTSNSLKTFELLEQNQQIMLPDAAKKARFLRTEHKRKSEIEESNADVSTKNSNLEQHLKQVYGTVAMEGGIHMSSIGPGLEQKMGSLPLRAGTNDMLGGLAYRGIPLTVVCTGYGNVAMEIIRRNAPACSGPGGSLSPHIKIVSNFFQPDESMNVVGMVDSVPLVHEGNKSGKTIMDFMRGARWDASPLTSRPNAMVICSDVADLELTNGIPGIEEQITVGYLKLDEHFQEKFAEFSNRFDVVVVGDGNLSFVNEILLEITSQ